LINKPRVLVGIDIHEDALARLKEEADVDIVPSSAFQDKEYLLNTIGGYDGVIHNVPRFGRDIVCEARRLKVVSCHSAREIDLEAASELGIHVTLTPELWETVADMTVALMLSAARMVPQAHSYVKNGQWKHTSDRILFSGTALFKKTLGIVGLGHIGTIVAKRVKGFDMRILYYDIARKTELEDSCLEYRPLRQLLEEADFVSIHIPLNEETRGLIGEEELKAMKKDAILVNTSRGPIVDEEALYRTLKEGQVAAAGLDVFLQEPLRPESPFLTLDNVVLIPHIAGSTRECDMQAVDNAIVILGGGVSPYQII
jgi:phosphoglycerate dehydrogenase-like enzyme